MYLARLNHEEAQQAPSRSRPWRIEEEWQPELAELSDGEFERLQREKDRSSRRLRRSHRASGINVVVNALPISSLETKTDWRNGFVAPPVYSSPQQKTVAYQYYKPKEGEKEPNLDQLLLANSNLKSIYLNNLKRKSSLSSTVPIVDEDIVLQQMDLMISNKVSASSQASDESSGRRISDFSDTSSGSLSSIDSQGPKFHRGFGASAKVFNPDG